MICKFWEKKEFDASTLPSLNWGVIIGHTVLKQGARTKAPPSGRDKNVFEYAYSSEMAKYLNGDIAHSFRDFGGVRGAVESLEAMNCNASIEHHLNAFNGQAKGFEVLFLKGDKESEYYALEFAQMFKETFPGRILRHSNGLKPISRGDRGYNNLKKAKKGGMLVALLSEAFFIDNSREWIEPEELAAFWNKCLF